MRIRHLMLATLLLGVHAPSGQSHAIAMARPGLWAVSHSANGVNPERLCLADPMLLTQWEHRSMRCSRSVIAERMDQLTVQYICPNGEFGRHHRV